MRNLIRLSAAILILLLLLLAGGYLYLRTSLPQTTGTVSVVGISGPLDIVRDAAGVPHIFAGTDNDAIFGLGYVHAQDRLWQMEMNRRIGNGRMSEVLGERTLEIDKFQRTMGYARVARRNFEVLSTRSQGFLEAYAAGVNAFLASGQTLPPEFLVLGVVPEPWTVYDSLVWMKMMAWDLAGDYDLELLRAQLVEAVGVERAAQLMPSYPADGRNIITALPDALAERLAGKLGTRIETDGHGFTTQTIDQIHATPRESAPAIADAPIPSLLQLDMRLQTEWGLGGREIGSNNWVINGEQSANGLPLVAGDPHLGTSIPAVWYLVEIQGETLHVTGATLPGIPGIALGHNDRIAWAVTNMDPDVQDLYMERINPANPNQVEVDGRWVDMTIIEEPIYIKGEPEPLRWAARATGHGPLISDVSDTGTPMAMRWTALDGDDTTYDAFIGINFANDWVEFTEAMRHYVGPSQNFVYGDVDGNIGYFGPGRIPIRAQGQGMIPVPGWDSSYAWVDTVPFDELPQMYNPPEGYIVTANNRVIDGQYPYLISNDWTAPFRAERIVAMIETLRSNGGTIDADEIAQMQSDQMSLEVTEFYPLLRHYTPVDQRQEQALAYLDDWDGSSGLESVASSIYEAWVVALPRALFVDDLRGDLFEQMANRANPTFLLNTLADPVNGPLWCDNVLTAPVEDCQETVMVALDQALDDLTARLGADMADWQWGKLHQLQYPHRPFSQVAALRWFFHRSIPNGGNRYTVNVAPVNINSAYDQTHSPSYRQIVDLHALRQSRFSLTTGQSGNALSPHYADRVTLHRDVQYMPMSWGRADVSGDRLELVPVQP